MLTGVVETLVHDLHEMLRLSEALNGLPRAAITYAHRAGYDSTKRCEGRKALVVH